MSGSARLKRGSKAKPIEERLRAWEARKGFSGILHGRSIMRKCAECNQPTRSMADSQCPKHSGKRQVHVYKECNIEGCTNLGLKAKGTRCDNCWVAEDPVERGCPVCQKKSKSRANDNGICSTCLDKAAVAAKRNAGREGLAQLCTAQEIEEGPTDATDAEFGKRYAVLNRQDDHKPCAMVRNGRQWQRACAVRGCPRKFSSAPGTPNTHCGSHGGGKCAHARWWQNCLECNPNIVKRANRCSRCVDKCIENRRQTKHGGRGLCQTCEVAVDAEAVAEAAAKAGKPPPPAAKKQKLLKQHELKMLERLVLHGYMESFTKGVAPRPGEFTREVYVDHRCALAREFYYGEKRCAYVDFVVNPKRGGKLVFLEIDEGEHKFPGYSVLCDTTRMWNVTESIKLDFSGDTNVLWLRVNPDTKFAIGDATHRQSNTVRCDAVCALLNTIEGRPDDPPMQVAYAFFGLKPCGANAVMVDNPEYNAHVRASVVQLAHDVGPDGVALRLV